MGEPQSLSHSKRECKYYVVFISRWRRKTLYGQLRRHLGEVLRKLATQKESRIEEGHPMPDHVSEESTYIARNRGNIEFLRALQQRGRLHCATRSRALRDR